MKKLLSYTEAVESLKALFDIANNENPSIYNGCVFMIHRKYKKRADIIGDLYEWSRNNDIDQGYLWLENDPPTAKERSNKLYTIISIKY